jgi:ribonuclease P protein component
MRTIGKKKEFIETLRSGRSKSYKNLTIFYLRGPSRDKAFGFSLPKGFGKSVERNLARRRMKAAVTKFIDDFPGGRYVIVARKSSHRARYIEIEEDIKKFCDEVKKEDG